MKFLPDTNALSLHLRGQDPALSARMRAAIENGEFVFSCIVYAELCYGAEKARLVGGHRATERLAKLRQSLAVESLSAEVAESYGRVRGHLEKRGEVIGNMDMLVAAHALALRATIVTHNIREFARVPGLKVEDWQSAD